MALNQQDITLIRDIFNEAFDELIEPRFEALDARFDAVDARFDVVERRLSSLEGEVHTGFSEINQTINSLSGRLEALEDDIKEIYKLISKAEHVTITDKKFAKLNLEKKLLILNTELLNAAKQAGITLPR